MLPTAVINEHVKMIIECAVNQVLVIYFRIACDPALHRENGIAESVMR
jgi:hypothetical protein